MSSVSVLERRDFDALIASCKPGYSLPGDFYSSELIYRAELDWEEVVHTLTRAQPPGWTGYTRRVDADLLREVAWPAADRPLAFVCGPTSFVESVAGDLVALGYAPGRIKTERFGATGGR